MTSVSNVVCPKTDVYVGVAARAGTRVALSDVGSEVEQILPIDCRFIIIMDNDL